MGVRAPDDRTARDLGLLAVERRRIHTGGQRDPGAGASKRVSSSAPRRFRARAARTAPRPVPHRRPGPVRRGRRCPVQAPPEDGRERPPPRLEVLGGVAGGPRGGPPDGPVPDAARRGVVPGRNRSHRRRGSQCERLMAHPSIAAFHLAVGDSMVRKKTLSELDQAEIKLQSLFEKRDALNQEAQLLRQERDLVHEKKREIGAKLRALKDRRASFAGEARKHREKRDDLQAKAKALIEMKRKLRGSGTADVGTELRSLKRRVSQMEMRQQTASLTLGGKRVARRTQGIYETPQATRDPQVGPRQDCERDQGHRLWDHGVLSGRGEGARGGRRAQREGALGPRGDRRNRPSDRRPDPRWQ